jgi:hypothetical protein
MRWRSSPSDESARAWFAGLITFAATLTAIAVLALAKTAQAEVPLLSGPGPLVAALAGGEAEADEEAEAAEADYEAEGPEDEEEAEDEEAGANGEPPYECLLRTARATVVVQEPQSRLRLQLSYTTFEPAAVAVEYRLRGAKGSLSLASPRRQLSQTGVLRESEPLSESELKRAMATRDVIVRLRVLGAPADCGRYYTRRLENRHEAAGRVTWLQTDSVFGS